MATAYHNIGWLYYHAKAKGQELPGFGEFWKSTAFICTTTGNGTPAAKAGMDGEYYVLEFADWTVDSDASLFAKNEELRGKPKTIVVMKDDKISQFHLESSIGIQFGFKKVGDEEKQRILKAYQAWKQSR